MVSTAPDTKGASEYIEHSTHADETNEAFDTVKDYARLRADADLATEHEHNTKFVDGVKQYPKAVFWSAVISMAIIMDGYDTALIGSLFAFPAFQRRFGHEIGDSGKSKTYEA
jgi:SP family general alpha glucoside:H+ symporter-like MFS transporter